MPTPNTKTAEGRFLHLDGLRRGYLNRCEKYAKFTLPRVCPPDTYDTNTDELLHDWQSVGAQVTNHLVNKLMLTMFAPSRPFMRLSLEATEQAKLMALLQLKPEQVQEWLAGGEQLAVKELDNRPIRTHLFDVLAALTIIGDALLYLPRDDPEAATTFNIKNYVKRLTPSGKIAELIVKEPVVYSDLEPDVQALYSGQKAAAQDDTCLWLYHVVKRTGKDRLEETTWLEGIQLPDKYSGTYSDEECPWVSLTWHLAKGKHYGTGHVEDYSGDFAALSSLSQAQIEGALLASEFRWLVNPGGATKVEDLMRSKNGSAIPGLPGDVELITNSKSQDLQVVRGTAEDYVRRIGHGFLMPTAMTRDAERVTAEEIRQQAVELETGLGGVYTRLATSLQPAVARWLLSLVNLDLKGSKIKLSIVTGLDALSRNGDLAALRAALADVAGLAQLGGVIQELRLSAIISAIFLGHGLAPSTYVKSAEEKQADQQAAEEAQSRAVGTEAAAAAAARAPQ